MAKKLEIDKQYKLTVDMLACGVATDYSSHEDDERQMAWLIPAGSIVTLRGFITSPHYTRAVVIDIVKAMPSNDAECPDDFEDCTFSTVAMTDFLEELE